MGRMLLNGVWGLTYSEGSTAAAVAHYTRNNLEGRRLLAAQVPAPIHRVLTEAGLLEDPNLGMNSLRARWVEEVFWIYRRVIDVPKEAVNEPAWLTFARLECAAVIYLNGEEVGRHLTAHRPARIPISGRLRPGPNTVAVCVSSGLFEVADRPGSEYLDHPAELLTKRHWLRKPQYQNGWDWSPRLMNVGILGDVSLEWGGVSLDQLAVTSALAEDLASGSITVRCWIENRLDRPAAGRLRVDVPLAGAEGGIPIEAPPGRSEHRLTIPIETPRLWWPLEHGESFLYDVEVVAEIEGTEFQRKLRTGLRRVEVDQSSHPVRGRHFILKINNRPIFCKGGNWVPPDLMYAAVEDERIERLVELAVEANFNFLRIWGGGSWVPPRLARLCDERGIMLWHDLLFACGKFPGDDPEFAAEVRREVTWGMRAYAHHPSLVVWCGNNEVEWGDWDWGYDQSARTHPHYALFHHDLPKIAAEENRSVFYWISSPFSPDFAPPNDPERGDQHPWDVSLRQPGGADFWEYRNYFDRFPNEGGVLGVSSPATLRQFLPSDEQFLLSPSWDHHDNPYALLPQACDGSIGRAYETVKLWLGRDPLQMGWTDYAFASSMLQAEGLWEYIRNYRRRMYSSASAVFWMFNDSWPVTHGWTIVDYYLRRKLAYHPVRRGFAPVAVFLAREGDRVLVYGVNDTPRFWSGVLRYGVFGMDGTYVGRKSMEVDLPPNSATELGAFPMALMENHGLTQCGGFAVLQEGIRIIAQDRIFFERFKDLGFVRDPKIRLKRTESKIYLISDVFVWGVCMDLDGEIPLDDNCFDLLPGIPYEVDWHSSMPKPRLVRVASRDLFLSTEGAS